MFYTIIKFDNYN